MAAIETRTSKDGEKRYRVKVRLLGQEPRTRTFKRLTDAKAWAAASEPDLSRGDHVDNGTAAHDSRRPNRQVRKGAAAA